MKAAILSLVCVLCILSIQSVAFADHNEATKDYKRTVPQIPIDNASGGIQVTYLDNYIQPAKIVIDRLLDDTKTWASFNFAYGEGQQEDDLTIDVEKYMENREVQVPFKVSGQFCQADTTGFIPIMTCVFRGYTHDGSEPIWDAEDEKWMTAKELEEEAKEQYRKYHETHKEPPTVWEALEESLPEKSDSPSKQALIEKVRQLNEIPSECMQGIGTTLGIQNERSFEIPVIEVPIFIEDEHGELADSGRTQWILDESMPLTAIQIRGYLAELLGFVRECAAQQVLLNDQGGILSSHDRTVGYLDSLGNPTHQEMAATDRVYTQNYINALMNSNDKLQTIEEFMREKICNEESYYSALYRDTVCGTEYEHTGPVTDGFIEYESDLHDEYLEFKNGNEEPMIEKLKQQAREKYFKHLRGFQ